MFLLVYHRIALLASTYSRAKGVCLFSFIVPELDPAKYVCHELLTKLGVTLGAWPETGARYPLPRLRDVCCSGPVETGSEALIGAEGETVSWQGSEGRVRIKGEIWLARSDASLAAGNHVKVVGRDGLVLRVEDIRGNPEDCVVVVKFAGSFAAASGSQ